LQALPEVPLIDAKIRSAFLSEAPTLQAVSNYLYSTGGKHLRPALCVLSAKCFNLQKADERVINAAAAIELIHHASLLHDDIIDNSLTRRKQPSPFAKYGLPATLLAGDFLYLRAFGLCITLTEGIVKEFERSCLNLTEGEMLETPLYNERHSLESALQIARKKTASLFTLAAVTGTHLAEANQEVIEEMRLFGENLGVAFQILDDILDVTSTTEIMGKKPGIDLHERKPSCINVLWLNSAAPLAKTLLTPPATDDWSTFIPKALKELKASPIISEAQNLAADFVKKGEQHLQNAIQIAPTTSEEAAKALHYLLNYSLKRNN
jgi:octaprenyl-diphosphate synthase